MRFSGSTTRGKNVRVPVLGGDAYISGTVTQDSGNERVVKFVVTMIGSGFLALACLALWILWIAKTGTYGPREAALSILACLPFAVAVYVAKTKALKFGQLIMTGIIVAMLTAVGSLLPQWSTTTTALLTLVPLFAILHLARYSVLTAAGLAIVGIGIIQYCANITDPLQLTLVAGLHLIASMFSLQTKVQLQRLRAKVARGDGSIDHDRASSIDLVTQHDADGLTLFASNAAMLLLGVESKELLNLGLHDKVHVQDRVAMLKAIADAAATLTAQKSEFRIRCKPHAAAGWKWVSMQCVPERNETTGAVLVNARIQDISAAREQIEQLRIAKDAEARARHGQRSLLEKLRNRVQAPLSELVKKAKGLDETDATQAYVSQSASQLQKSLDELMVSTDIEIGQYSVFVKNFQVIDAIGESVRNVRPEFTRSGVALLSEIPANLPAMHSDRAIVTRIFSTVLRSVADQAQGMTSVSIKARQHGAWIRIAVNCQGNLPGVNKILDGSVAQSLITVLGGSCEETRRSADKIIIDISLPIRLRASATTRKPPHPQQSDYTSEGDSRARLSA